MSSDWIDRHSVTCALCGEPADERETISLWETDYDGRMRERVSDLPDGEAHKSCFDAQETRDGEHE